MSIEFIAPESDQISRPVSPVTPKAHAQQVRRAAARKANAVADVRIVVFTSQS